MFCFYTFREYNRHRDKRANKLTSSQAAKPRIISHLAPTKIPQNSFSLPAWLVSDKSTTSLQRLIKLTKPLVHLQQS